MLAICQNCEEVDVEIIRSNIWKSLMHKNREIMLDMYTRY